MTLLSRRSRSVLAAAFGITLLSVLVPLTPAAAHDELLSSSPAPNDLLELAPEEVALTFSDEVLTLGAMVLVIGDDDTDWASGDAVLEGTEVTTRVEAGMPDGAYEVRWRVVSSDGHPIAGVIPFTVGDAPGPAEPDDSETGAGADEASASTDASVPADEAIDTADSAATGDVWRTVLVALGGAGAAVLIWLLFLAWRRRRPRDTASPATETSPADTEHPKGS